MNVEHVVVVGAGIGGMTAAAHLAQRGLKVTVVEKNSRPGGRCDQVEHDGHRFDTGPTLLVMPKLLGAEFEALGSALDEHLELKRIDPTYHLVFDDNSRLHLTSDMYAMESQLEAIEPGSFSGLLRYLDEGHRHYDVAIDKLVRRDFRSATDFFDIRNIPLLWQVKPLQKHYAHMSAFFDSPRLKSAFTFQDVYMGLSPFQAPATFSLMPYSELAHGVWFPRGGMHQLALALERIASASGVDFEYRSKVKRIAVGDGLAKGVELADGRFLAADAVVANADLPYVYDRLLPDDGTASCISRKRFSCSVFSFFWSLDKRYDELPPHTLFIPDAYHDNFVSIIDDLSIAANPALYVHAPTRLDDTMAPAGRDTIIGIVPVGHLSDDGSQDWGAIRDHARSAVLRRLADLGLEDFEQHITHEFSFNPLSWRKRYNLARGATHGLCHNLTQLAYFRPKNRHRTYRNLYFVGASTHPGTGLPSAMVSGRLTASRLAEEQCVGSRPSATEIGTQQPLLGQH